MSQTLNPRQSSVHGSEPGALPCCATQAGLSSALRKSHPASAALTALYPRQRPVNMHEGAAGRTDDFGARAHFGPRCQLRRVERVYDQRRRREHRARGRADQQRRLCWGCSARLRRTAGPLSAARTHKAAEGEEADEVFMLTMGQSACLPEH